MQSDRRAPPKPRFSTTVPPNCCSRFCHNRTEELPTNTTAPGRGGLDRSIAAKSRMACAQRPGPDAPAPRSPAYPVVVQSRSNASAKRSTCGKIVCKAAIPKLR